MAKKTASGKAAAAASAQEPRPAQPSEALDRARFERELQSLAQKAKTDASTSKPLEQSKVFGKTALLLGLLGVYAVVSQKTLSPVYGEIPSSLLHTKLLMGASFIGWAGNLFLRNVMRGEVRTVHLLPVVAAWIPLVQYFLFGFSQDLTAKWGPLITEGLTLGPLCVLTASAVADVLEDADLSALPDAVAEAVPGLGSWAFFKLASLIAEIYLRMHIGRGFLYTRIGLQSVLAGVYAVTAPSKFLYFALPALLHTAFLNTHVMTPMATASLNTTLQLHNYTLLERKESVTGYISVLENHDRGYRVLRCDHSLLGGEWTKIASPIIPEPIYGVFVMLEAVRLVRRETRVADQDAKALVIGLGIGTTPTALVHHGIDTTIVEIDPVVHEFADKYFGLKENNPPVLQDAVSYTQKLLNESKTYDYIVHDVFTGGAEPVDLFTLEFLQGLNSLLKPDGVIAINYAGDLSHPAPRIVVNTINDVFPNCRIFRESEPDPELIKVAGMDFTNMVIFCQKTNANPLAFRRPVMEDFLQSRARQMFLEPKHEVKEEELFGGKDVGILRANDTEVITEWHKTSALGHWAVMRTVIPPQIWELW